MILVASQRGNAGELARHLLKEENDHVTVHELRGFVSDDLSEAFREAQAIAKGTKCQQFLFSLSINPPEDKIVCEQDLVDAANLIEDRLGLTYQPRAIVFHEKQGRRHAHVVWSRIKAETMTAITMSHYKNKCCQLSKELFLTHGWVLPKGLEDRSLSDPSNFSREEWQQALRAGRDVRELKACLRQCWQGSDDQKSLEAALETRGFVLAKGDRRGVVAVDYLGEVYALARYAGVKAKDVKARISDNSKLPSIIEAKDRFRARISPRLDLIKRQQSALHDKMKASHKAKLKALADAQRTSRNELHEMQEARQRADQSARQAQLNKEMGQGLKAVWHHLTGKAAKLKKRAEFETWQAYQRDQQERDEMVWTQLQERLRLNRETERLNSYIQTDKRQLDSEMASILAMDRSAKPPDHLRQSSPLHDFERVRDLGMER